MSSMTIKFHPKQGALRTVWARIGPYLVMTESVDAISWVPLRIEKAARMKLYFHPKRLAEGWSSAGWSLAFLACLPSLQPRL